MAIADALIGELEQEAATTRRVLQRVPADKLAWKPHEKSMSLGQLALHVAQVPGFAAGLAVQNPGSLPENFEQASAQSVDEALSALADSVGKAKEIVQGFDDAAMMERLGVSVRVFSGDDANIKVTTPEDLVIAEALLGASAHSEASE